MDTGTPGYLQPCSEAVHVPQNSTAVIPVAAARASALFTEPRGQQARLEYEQSREGQLPSSSGRQLRTRGGPAAGASGRGDHLQHTQRPPADHGRASQKTATRVSLHLPAPPLRRAAEMAHGETPQRLDVTPNSKVQGPPCADWRPGVFSPRCTHTYTHSHPHLCTNTMWGHQLGRGQGGHGELREAPSSLRGVKGQYRALRNDSWVSIPNK